MRRFGYILRPSAGGAVLLVLLLAVLGRVAAAPERQAAHPQILAHYMPWFEARPESRQWGWHWTMNHFDPSQVKEGVPSIASHYRPLIGPYDSRDPAVIEYHLLLMKLAGIDGIVVDWYGLAELYDYPLIHRNTAALFGPAARLGLKVAICYEDQTIPKLVAEKRLAAADRVKHARGEMDWLRKDWYQEPAYLRAGGKPVLLSFGWDGLTEPEWEQVFDAPDHRPLYLSQHRRRTVAAGTFDWPQPKAWQAGLDQYYRSAEAGRPFMPVSFPRFHDVYAEAKVQPSYGSIPDDAGRTFTTTLKRALTSGASMVQIATWNDWGEGTVIEPSYEFGYRDLEAVQRLRREHVDPRFAVDPGSLRLPHRLWLLRGKQGDRPALKTALDTTARLLAANRPTEAAAAIARADSLAAPGTQPPPAKKPPAS
jgi:hypothetical protein